MIIYQMVLKVVKRIFEAFKGFFLPTKKDLLGSLILSIPMYFLFGLSLIFLLPLIIAGVFVVFIIRRIWKLIMIYFTVNVMRRKTEKDVEKIKQLLE